MSGHRHRSSHHGHSHHRTTHGRSFTLKRGLVGLLALAAVFAVIYVGVGWLEKKDDQKISGQSGSTQKLWASVDTLYLENGLFGIDGRTESYLFVGTDDSEYRHVDTDEYVGPLADFILLMVLDYTNHSYGFVQIDRNTITEIYQYGTDGALHGIKDQQICTAHMYGKDLTQSAENTVKAVSEFLGYLENIHGYFVMNMDEMEQLNAAAGEIEVTIPEDLTSVDPSFVKGAKVKLSGKQAERFVRARENVGGGTNVERMSRQRLYMDSFFQEMTRQSKKKPSYYLDIYETLRKIGTSNMNGNDYSRIANMLLTGENKGMLTISGETIIGNIYDDGEEHEEFYADDESIEMTLKALLPLVPIDEDEDLEEETDE